VDAETEGREPGTPPAPTGGRSLAAAVVTALILLGLIIGFNLLGPKGFVFLAAAVILIAQFELLDALRSIGRHPSYVIGLGGTAALLIATFLERPFAAGLILAVTTYAALLYALRPRRGPTPASDAAWTMFGVLWIGGGGAGVVAILTIGRYPALLLTAMVLTTALHDIGGFFAGTRFGKNRMAPSISPKKSWEGYAGGVAAALAGGVFFGVILPDLTIPQGLGLALVAAVFGPAGDIVESLVKRELGIKDSGRLLPGHGGSLDRIDAILFAAPAAYLYLRLVLS
jgi:phosphatidate cytidylyltransferase